MNSFMEESLESAKKLALKEFMGNFMNVLVDEVCVYDALEQKGLTNSENFERKRLVPMNLGPEDKNVEVLGNLQLKNEIEKENGKFGWFLDIF